MVTKMDENNPKIFRVKGKFLMGGSMQPFMMELVSMRPEDVKEKIFSDIGSKHKVKRSKILIDSIEEISAAESMDPVVKYMAGE